MKDNRKIIIGKFGQKLAAEFLLKRGYKIINQNFYTRFGELDLVAQNEDQIVFVEVKTRSTQKFGLPEDALTKNKKEKMTSAALEFLEKNTINHDNYRFDLIAIEIDGKNKKAFIRQYKNV